MRTWCILRAQMRKLYRLIKSGADNLANLLALNASIEAARAGEAGNWERIPS